MKRCIFLSLGLLCGLSYLEALPANAAEEPKGIAIALTRAKAEETIKQGRLLKARIKEILALAEAAKAKAKEALSRSSLEERSAREDLLAGASPTPEVMADRLDIREIEMSQVAGMKVAVSIDQVVKRTEDVLALVDKATSISEDVLGQIELTEKDPAFTLAATTIEMSDEALNMIKKAGAEEREIAREAALVADEAAKADYYSRYREREKKEEVEVQLAEEGKREVPLIRAFKVVPGKKPRAGEHTVVKGDCLWFIADHYYKNPFLWPKIYEENKEKIKDPHWIYPGQVFIIPEAE